VPSDHPQEVVIEIIQLRVTGHQSFRKWLYEKLDWNDGLCPVQISQLDPNKLSGCRIMEKLQNTKDHSLVKNWRLRVPLRCD
jgi:hypothetical protein